MERHYANVINVHSGPFDVTIDFGQKVGGEGDPEYALRVSMSWEHAVSMALVLQRMIENYEAQIGPLPDVTKVLTLDMPSVPKEGEDDAASGESNGDDGDDDGSTDG